MTCHGFCLGHDIIDRAVAAFVHPQTQARILIGILTDLQWTPVSLHPDVNEPEQLTQLCTKEASILEESGQWDLFERFCRNARELGLTLPAMTTTPSLVQLQEQGDEHEQEETNTANLLETFVTEGNPALNHQQALEEVIRLRNEGQLEEALRRIDAALANGVADPWWLDNKARVLLALGNRDEAIQIWEQLAGIDDPHLAEVAVDMLTSAQAQHPVSPERIVSDERQELQDVISLRDKGYPEEALERIDAALSAGATNPWWLDNKARTLVDLGHRFDALEIWERLISDFSDQALVATATEMAARLRAGFEEPMLQLCADADWIPQHLHSDQDRPLLDAVLQEVITTREAGHIELSLSLAEMAKGQGLTSPSLENNRARAMLMLHRPASAAEVWTSLAEQQSGDGAASARQMAAEAWQLFIAGLRDLCAQHGWMPRHLPEEDEQAKDLAHLCLQEVIAAREEGQVLLSLLLTERAQQAGLESGWLKDNQARALVRLDREAEAVALWLDLKDDANPQIAEMANEMLDLFGVKVQRRNICEQANQMISRGEVADASSLLVSAMLEDSEYEEYRQCLSRLIEQETGSRYDSEFGNEIRKHELSLEIHRRLLDAVERRLGLVESESV